MAKLYKEGLIDKEIFTLETAQFIAKGGKGIILAQLSWRKDGLGSIHVSNTSNTNIGGTKHMNDFIDMPALKGSSLDSYISTFKKMGVDELMKIYQDASDRYKKN